MFDRTLIFLLRQAWQPVDGFPVFTMEDSNTSLAHWPEHSCEAISSSRVGASQFSDGGGEKCDWD